ncbi:MAG: TraR/DksA family transcriptional regulator [Acidobacteriota bacterium]
MQPLPAQSLRYAGFFGYTVGLTKWQFICMTAEQDLNRPHEDEEERHHMDLHKNPGGEMNRDRHAELASILEERRREIMGQVQDRIRDVRTESPNNPATGVLDAAESSEADIQDEIEFALIQMKAETLHKIEEALHRLEEGTFGYCFECGDEISERRLRALPFAVRCKDCEEARETAQQRERQIAQRRGNASLFVDMQG